MLLDDLRRLKILHRLLLDCNRVVESLRHRVCCCQVGLDHHYKVLKISEELSVIGDPSYRAHQLPLGVKKRNWSACDLQRNARLDNLYNRLLRRYWLLGRCGGVLSYMWLLQWLLLLEGLELLLLLQLLWL